MIILTCNECNSENLKVYEGRMTELGHDWFTCKDCKHNFPLKVASYSNEDLSGAIDDVREGLFGKDE